MARATFFRSLRRVRSRLCSLLNGFVFEFGLFSISCDIVCAPGGALAHLVYLLSNVLADTFLCLLVLINFFQKVDHETS